VSEGDRPVLKEDTRMRPRTRCVLKSRLAAQKPARVYDQSSTKKAADIRLFKEIIEHSGSSRARGGSGIGYNREPALAYNPLLRQAGPKGERPSVLAPCADGIRIQTGGQAVGMRSGTPARDRHPCRPGPLLVRQGRGGLIVALTFVVAIEVFSVTS